MKFTIKICAPGWEDAKHWGDYHIALALKKHFRRNGCDAKIQIKPEWYNGEDDGCDATIHLRGLHRYTVSKRHVNIMWNISHPELVRLDEYEDYDIVFVASEIHAANISRRIKTKVIPLLQCTDLELFYPDLTKDYVTDVLFVGNSRNIYRKIIKDLLPATHELHIWGTLWEQFISKKYIRGEYFPNENLRQLYSSCKILLNDHWDDMREQGFISNRIFDALACKAFVISDEVAGWADVLSNAVVTYRDRYDLLEKVEYYYNNEPARREVAEKGYALVTTYHTFNERVRTILSHLQPGHVRRRVPKGI